jgi:hypothetical protein
LGYQEVLDCAGCNDYNGVVWDINRTPGTCTWYRYWGSEFNPLFDITIAIAYASGEAQVWLKLHWSDECANPGEINYTYVKASGLFDCQHLFVSINNAHEDDNDSDCGTAGSALITS